MHQENFLVVILLILTAAVFVVALFKKLRLSPVLGYFVAGGVIGEHGFKIITSEEAAIFGEIGVVFLLFAIGLELTFERLKSMRRYVFGFGSAQVITSSIIIGFITYFLGVKLNSAMIIGGGLALSSTAIVLQVLAENREQNTQVGRLSLAILLMQDFAVVPLLVMIPMFSGEQIGIVKPLIEALGKAIIVLIGIMVVGRLLLRPMFHMISSSNSAKSNELFIATTLLIALGSAWCTQEMGLSLALGAFVAGILVAETEFQLQAEESIAPFKGLLLGLFFMSVGMSINLRVVMDNILMISILSGGLIFVKAIIIFFLCLIFRFQINVAIHSGLLLSQGGEFAFILFRLADRKNIIDPELSQILLLIVTITMAITPLIGILGSWISRRNEKKVKFVAERIYKEIADLENHVIILGFGRVGQMVARLLEAENVNYVAVDIDSEHVVEQKKDGYPVYLGDAASIEMLRALAIERSSTVIVAMENEVTLKKVTRIIRQNYQQLPVVVRAEDLGTSGDLYEAGATTIVPETYETGLQLGGAVLKTIGISEFEISRIKNRFRDGNYLKLPQDNVEESLEEVFEDVNNNII